MAKRTKKRVAPEGVMEISTAAKRLMIPSGVTLLDLACTDTTDGFIEAGHAVNSVGARNAGKTFQALASMAETFRRYGDAFEYKLIDAENAYQMNTAALFGREFAKRLEVIPVPLEIEWCTQALAQKMLGWMGGKKPKPQFMVLDCMDQLLAEQEYENDEDGKLSGALALRAVANKYLLRRVIPKIASTGSFLIYLSQEAESIGFGAKFNPKMRGGGKALGFYAFVEMWLSKGGQIKEGDVKVGDWTIAKVARSKGNGKAREVWFPILPAYGIDDTRANLEWLWEEGVIKPAKKEDDDDNHNKQTVVKPDKKVYGIVKPAEKEEDGDGKKKKGGNHVFDLRKIGIDYEGKEAALFVETNGLIGKVVEAVKARWDANEQLLIDKTFGGRASRYA